MSKKSSNFTGYCAILFTLGFLIGTGFGYLTTYIQLYENQPIEMDAKPVIYVYAEHDDTEVNVKLGYTEKLSCVYPEYGFDGNTGWDVVADKSGKLSIGDKDYYSLYWEGIDSSVTLSAGDTGFCIAGKDTAKFLEEALSTLGLTDYEREEFIIYWLPKMQDNAYNLIKFESRDVVDNYMSLDITADGEQVDAENIIRVYMVFKGVDKFTDMKSQELTKVERNTDNITVIEWGGTEL